MARYRYRKQGYIIEVVANNAAQARHRADEAFTTYKHTGRKPSDVSIRPDNPSVSRTDEP